MVVTSHSKLRDYQVKCIKELSLKLNGGSKRVLLYSVTGSGKTVIAKSIIEKILKTNKKVFFLVEGVELVRQTHLRLPKPSSMIMGQEKSKIDYKSHLQIGSVHTIYSRRKSLEEYLKQFDFVFIDECHNSTSNMYKEVINMFTKAMFIGMTATPFEINKKRHMFWDDYVQPATGEELVKSGYLAPLRIFAPPIKFSRDKLKKNSIGEYTNESLFDAVDSKTLYSSFSKEFKKHGSGKVSIIFCVNIKHAKSIEDQLKVMNIQNIFRIDSEQRSSVSRSNLEKAREKIAKKEPVAIVSVNKMNAGMDIPELEVGFMIRPTGSLVLWFQQIGRLMRISPNKRFAKIIDFTDNSFIFANPQVVNYEPQIKEKREGETILKIKFKTCAECFYINPIGVSRCDSCGADMSSSSNQKDISFDESVELKEVDESYFDMVTQFKQLREIMNIYDASIKIHKIYGDKSIEINGFSKRYKEHLRRKDSISFRGFTR